MISTSVLDQRVDLVSPRMALNLVKKSVKQNRRELFFALNVNILVQLHQDQLFKKEFSDLARVIYADGVPILWLSFFSKNRLQVRVSGTDLVESILKDNKLKVFLLGSTPEVLKKIQQKYPSVCGVYSPPHNQTWQTKEKSSIVKKINSSKAQVLLVALGPLKQERWLINNIKNLEVNSGLGIGSALDILAGERTRAPKILKDYGFEWLWRMFLEPERLAKRYFFDFIYLLAMVLRLV